MGARRPPRADREKPSAPPPKKLFSYRISIDGLVGILAAVVPQVVEMSWETRAILIVIAIGAICDLVRRLPVHIAGRSALAAIAIIALLSSSWRQTVEEFRRDPGIFQVFGFAAAPLKNPLSAPPAASNVPRNSPVISKSNCPPGTGICAEGGVKQFIRHHRMPRNA